ncbi:MAG: MFS transporter [Bacteroidota bacterium]
MNSTYNYNKVFAAACLGMFLFGAALISVGSFMPAIIQKFNFDTLQAGTLASVLPAGILLGSLLFGPIVDRFSYKYLLAICSIVFIAGMEGIAFANSLTGLQISFFFIGVGGGALNGGTNALVADISVDSKKTGSANLSLLGVFFGIGALGMPVVLSLLSSALSFEQIIKFIGLAVILPLMYFMATRFPAAKQTRVLSLKESLKLAGDKKLLILAMFLFFQSAIEGIANNWTTTFLQEQGGVDAKKALMALSVFVASLTTARLLLSVILRKQSPFLVLLFSISLVFIGGVILLIVSTFTAYLAGLVFVGLGVAAGFPVILGFVSELYHNARGTAFSVAIFIGLLGNISINYLTGIVAHRFGIEKFPLILLLCALALFIITVTKLKIYHKK